MRPQAQSPEFRATVTAFSNMITAGQLSQMIEVMTGINIWMSLPITYESTIRHILKILTEARNIGVRGTWSLRASITRRMRYAVDVWCIVFIVG